MEAADRAEKPRRDVPLALAAEALGLNKQLLRQAAESERVRCDRRVRGSRVFRYFSLDELGEDLDVLDRCHVPGCALPALGDEGECGTRGHAQVGKKHSAERVAKNSAAHNDLETP